MVSHGGDWNGCDCGKGPGYFRKRKPGQTHGPGRCNICELERAWKKQEKRRERYGARKMVMDEIDMDVLAYIQEHPNASPQEVCAHFGIAFNRKLWEEAQRECPEVFERLRQSTNPYDRAWTEKPS